MANFMCLAAKRVRKIGFSYRERTSINISSHIDLKCISEINVRQFGGHGSSSSTCGALQVFPLIDIPGEHFVTFEKSSVFVLITAITHPCSLRYYVRRPTILRTP